MCENLIGYFKHNQACILTNKKFKVKYFITAYTVHLVGGQKLGNYHRSLPVSGYLTTFSGLTANNLMLNTVYSNRK